MYFVYVPAPVYGALKNAGFTGNDFVDLSKLLNILSPSDVAFYVFHNLEPSSDRLAPWYAGSFKSAWLGSARQLAATIENPRQANDFYKAYETLKVTIKPLALDEYPILASGVINCMGRDTILLTEPVEAAKEAKDQRALLDVTLFQMLQFVQDRFAGEVSAGLHNLAPLPIFEKFLQVSKTVLEK